VKYSKLSPLIESCPFTIWATRNQGKRQFILIESGGGARRYDFENRFDQGLGGGGGGQLSKLNTLGQGLIPVID
jgi:hypothetical protein